jgi:hypothetical protein
MIRRLIHVVLILGTVMVAWFIRPAPVDPSLDVGVEPAPPTYLGCIGRVERDLSSLLAIGSVVRGDMLATAVTPGEGRSVSVPIDAAGGATLDFAEVGSAGIGGLLAELPTADAGATVVVTREDVAAAAACTPASTETLLVSGGSTATGETLDLVLTNPYAVDAVVAVGSSSESGEDSASEIASILVPARTTVVRALEPLLSLRQSLSVQLQIQSGAIHAAMIQNAKGDVAVTEAIEPGQDWWLPVLNVRDATGRLVIATDSPLAVDVVIDGYTAGSLSEAIFEGTVEPRSQIDLPISDLARAPIGLRVSATGPVVVTLVIDGENTRAVTPATTLSTEWVLPGSGSVRAAASWIFNPGEVEAVVIIQPLSPDAPAREATVPAGAAVGVRLEPAGAGFLIRSSSEIAVFWSGRQGGLSLATGSPLDVLTE